jgi:hypothetical protein
MLQPLMGMILVGLLLTPFAVVYLLTVREVRNLPSLVLFFVGSGLWLFVVSAGYELFEIFGRFPPLAWLVFAAPLSGVALNWIRKSRDVPEFRLGLAHAVLLVTSLVFHFAYLASFDYYPEFSDGELVGTWRGDAGTLILSSSDIGRNGDFPVVIKGRPYVVARSFGRLCLVEREDPDSTSVEYRKF